MHGTDYPRRTTAELKESLKLYMISRAKDSEVDLLLKYYPDDQRAECPFDTGLKNALSTVARTQVLNNLYSRDDGQVHSSSVQPPFREILYSTARVGSF